MRDGSGLFQVDHDRDLERSFLGSGDGVGRQSVRVLVQHVHPRKPEAGHDQHTEEPLHQRGVGAVEDLQAHVQLSDGREVAVAHHATVLHFRQRGQGTVFCP